MQDDKKGKKDMKGSKPVNVQQYLAGVDYPATKQDLIDAASDNDAPQEVIEALSGVAEKEYGSAADVSAELGK